MIIHDTKVNTFVNSYVVREINAMTVSQGPGPIVSSCDLLERNCHVTIFLYACSTDGRPSDVLYKLNINHFRNRESLQLLIRDII